MLDSRREPLFMVPEFQVSLLFKDASIGNAISIAIVDIAILHHGDFSHSNSQGTLKKFCDWKHMYMAEDIHDAALLLTR